MQELLGPLIGAIYGGIGGGMGGGGLGPMLGVLLGEGFLVPAAGAFIVPAWILLTYGVARTSYFYTVKRRERELAGSFSA